MNVRAAAPPSAAVNALPVRLLEPSSSSVRVGFVQRAPQRHRAETGPTGEEHRIGAAALDLFDLAGEHRSRRRDDAVVPGYSDARMFRFVDHEFGERHLERVLIVEHVQLAHAQRAHQLRLRDGLRRIARLQPRKGAFAARVEALGLVLAGVARGRQADVGAAGADLEDAGGVDRAAKKRPSQPSCTRRDRRSCSCPAPPSSRRSPSRSDRVRPSSGWRRPAIRSRSSIRRSDRRPATAPAARRRRFRPRSAHRRPAAAGSSRRQADCRSFSVAPETPTRPHPASAGSAASRAARGSQRARTLG